MRGQVNKLRITRIKNPKDYFKGGNGIVGAATAAGRAIAGIAGAVFEVQMNPESLSHNFKIKYNEPETKGDGEGQTEIQMDGIEPEVLDLKFILDGTGTVMDNSLISPDLVNLGADLVDSSAQLTYVFQKITQLKTTIYNFVDESHSPPTLVVNWGKLIFIGIMDELSINETLKHPSGLPLRAEINLKIKEQGLPASASAALSLLSPDLTRHHKVQAGENLVRICDDVYEEEKYYLEVAKVNGLTNFRKLKPGQHLILPPIDKSTT